MHTILGWHFNIDDTRGLVVNSGNDPYIGTIPRTTNYLVQFIYIFYTFFLSVKKVVIFGIATTTPLRYRPGRSPDMFSKAAGPGLV